MERRTEMTSGWEVYQFVQNIARHLEQTGERIDWHVAEIAGYRLKEKIDKEEIELEDISEGKLSRRLIIESKRNLEGKGHDFSVVPLMRGKVSETGGEGMYENNNGIFVAYFPQEDGNVYGLKVDSHHDKTERKMMIKEILNELKELWEGGRGPKPKYDYTLEGAVELEYGDVPKREYIAVKERLRLFRENHIGKFSEVLGMLDDSSRK